MRTIDRESIQNLFAGNIRKLLIEAGPDYEKLYEIRLRVGRPLFLAARKRAPVPLFLIPSVVPLIPGSTLYYTMSAAVQGNTEEVSHYGSLTLQYALSIAGGICIVWTILSIFRRYYVLRTNRIK